jgi:hypothetical protein
MEFPKEKTKYIRYLCGRTLLSALAIYWTEFILRCEQRIRNDNRTGRRFSILTSV